MIVQPPSIPIFDVFIKDIDFYTQELVDGDVGRKMDKEVENIRDDL